MIESEKVGDYLEALASGSATPGGGAAAALTLAQAAALVSMVCNFTLGREKFRAVEGQVRGILDHANGIRQQALETADADVEAYEGVRAAHRLPVPISARDTAKAEAIQKALENAATVPWLLAESCDVCYTKALELRPICNQNLVSDIDVAICLLQAAVAGLWVNVDINLKSIDDKAFTENLRVKIRTLVGRIRAVDPVPVKELLGLVWEEKLARRDSEGR